MGNVLNSSVTRVITRVTEEFSTFPIFFVALTDVKFDVQCQTTELVLSKLASNVLRLNLSP